MEAPLHLPLATASSSSSGATADESSSSPSTASIVARVVAVLAVASVSLFARHEASKGFHVDIVNAAPRDTVAGRRFDLFFVSNGKAERILHYANRGVEAALFPDASVPAQAAHGHDPSGQMDGMEWEWLLLHLLVQQQQQKILFRGDRLA
ncbi:hypothetical protein OsJ_19685 [Oryza sativa Japonica Group]|uniref:Uncharacterized protein n=1 Tax=Oryza sativa subsp. japonica TaxID=39947 RepID=B9FIQ4_ORYSJ|nr:hypothetical protein OsJ_19685 [Oryza sativa Japonica Group]